ncbi:non-ribosomal peptide synthetase, partial [Aquimarina sp. 2304DJ70-9]|uniref:non-ribosomal peptide synthetase n=1 Tax=Aquimarina penaris TaxID=3231044 RepID=UPI00346365FA
NKELLPIGVIGELYVGGESLAHGYLHNDKLTQERFVDNPYKANGRMYKTGDLARWLPDGNIEFLGRIDEQIKIRGFRIELGEIESELRNFEALEEAILVVKEKEGDRYLVCYYTSLEEISTSDLKHYLSDKLPEYMIPNHYVHLTSIPFNSSGKVDKKNLPEPEVKIEHDYVGPINATEKTLEKIWSSVLNLSIDVIGTNRNFFELGGHSLKAIVLVNKIAKEFDVVFPLEKIFENPTIKEQAEFINVNEWLSNDNTTDLTNEMIKKVII